MHKRGALKAVAPEMVRQKKRNPERNRMVSQSKNGGRGEGEESMHASGL